MAIDEQKMEEAVGKVFGELAVAVTGPLVVLGDRLGLWAALAGAGPRTPNELAMAQTNVSEAARKRRRILLSTLYCVGSFRSALEWNRDHAIAL